MACIIYISLAMDFNTTIDDGTNSTSDAVPSDACTGRNDLRNTTLAMAFVGVALAFSAYLTGALYHVRYPMINYPHAIHGTSLAGTLEYSLGGGGVGYNALKDFSAYLAYSVAVSCAALILLLILDTCGFTRPTALFSTVYLAAQRHPQNPISAPVAYGALLAQLAFWQMHFAIDAATVTWHMYHCGCHSGRRYFLTSPDSKATTVVRFASSVETREATAPPCEERT